MKHCPRCDQDKELSEFAFRNKAKGIRQPYCHACRKQAAKESYRNNKQAVVDKVKQRNRDKRDWFQDIKSALKCCVCGEDDAACLDFHHLDPSCKDLELSAAIQTRSKEAVIEEMNKCACLCANCHRKYHVGRITQQLVQLQLPLPRD